MLTAVFRGHEGFVLFLFLLAAACAAAVWFPTRRRLPRPAAYALWAASAVSVVALTLWTPYSSGTSGTCTVNRDVLEPFRTVQGQLNMGMFAPFGLLGVLATRRPLVVLALGLLTSTAVETVQGAAPFVGRLCDTSDLVANAAGVACGVAVGVLLTLRAARRSPLSRLSTRTSRRLLAGTGAGAVLLGGIWLLAISPSVVERTVMDVAASAEQLEAVDAAMRDAFGGHYSIESASFLHGEGESGTVAGHFQAGWAELNWPARDTLRVDLVPGHVEEGHAFAVPGAAGPADTAEDAQRIATGYAERYAPWATEGSRVTVEPVEEDAGPGWRVSWRRWQGDVLLPLRLDVLVEPSGRLTGLVARDVDDPALPAVKVTEERAWAAVERHFGQEAEKGERAEPVLLAVRDDGGAWRVHWLLNLRTGDPMLTAAVDATTGKLRPSETWDASLHREAMETLP